MRKRDINRFLFVIRTILRKNSVSKIEKLELCSSVLKDYALELKLYHFSDKDKFKNEINYIKVHGISYVPYEATKEMEPFEKGYDENLKLPFVLHKGKRLYFPHGFSLEYCATVYKGYISKECLLGDRYVEKAPHQYLTDHFNIEPGSILVDVGSAEALLALDNIEKIDKAYLIEGDPIWIPALEATFSDYKDKVVIINKYISNRDSEATITLKTLLKNEEGKKLFVKMDIEGAEVSVIEESKEYLNNKKDIKLACCTYHKQSDAERLESLYKEIGFDFEYSDGYMLFPVDENQEPPYFRHGVLRGWK